MISREVSERIQIARYLMVCGIVFIHVPPEEVKSVTDNAYFLFVRSFLVDGVFRGTVPLLTCISAYLIFLYGKDKTPLRLVRDKAESLIIPMIIWNLPIFVSVYLIQKYQLLNREFTLHLFPLQLFTALNVILGISDKPLNYPLFFLRDLFVLACLAPIFGLFIRKAPTLGFVIVAVIFWFDFDGLLLLRSSMALNFYIGGVAAAYDWDLFFLDRHRWSLLVLFIAASVLKCQTPGDSTLFRVVSPFMIWPVISFIQNSRFCGCVVRLSPGSFFMFLSHLPMLIASYSVYQMVAIADYPLYWFITSAAVIALCHIFYRIGSKKLPSIMQVALGGR